MHRFVRITQTKQQLTKLYVFLRVYVCWWRGITQTCARVCTCSTDFAHVLDPCYRKKIYGNADTIHAQRYAGSGFRRVPRRPMINIKATGVMKSVVLQVCTKARTWPAMYAICGGCMIASATEASQITSSARVTNVCGLNTCDSAGSIATAAS